MVATYFPGRGTLFEQTYLEGKAEGMAEGKAEGTAGSILRVLEKRGVPIAPHARQRIASETDLDTLTRWFDRSLTVATAQEIFSEE
ncbi:hypothetical protein [Streptomyces sp. NPDC057838]|uniref:hypothetical protein n=1 Tax=unclassified Streptomyces TaxID=2593676 RepID=UPI00367A62E0